MQSMPLLFRQSLRHTVTLSRPSARAVRSPLLSAVGPKALPVGNTLPRRSFSVCLQCQFRKQSALYSNETDKPKDEKPADQSVNAELAAAVREGILKTTEADAGSSSTSSQGSPSAAENTTTQKPERPEPRKDEGTERGSESDGSLPSYMENRRSQFAKQFGTMMDNLQSNVFVAGQRLNDLTGYSSIEALKNEIHIQEERLRTARLRVRETKDAYSAAINRRSTSQREVNELLQRKHAWSPADLERFTHLYRNDHTNEVAENEAQEALSSAERESEEAAAQLSRCILSRYHEEQVWSDKIRRMSTWGTWGLMGVNVLLFLIFQIAVEPWRRKRLVKGFEEKVIEAIEKEKVMTQTQIISPVVAQQQQQPEQSAVATTTPEVAEPSSTPTSDIQEQPAASNVSPVAPAESASTSSPSTPIEPTPSAEPTSAWNDTIKSQMSRLSSPQSVESWRQYFHDLFSDRSITITQRDLSSVALQSAAAGAAIMGLVIALIRPR
ncbi:hypothetical protein P170DRAFT_446815 [Aspergillus steynii IBT 23096]|uniref:Sensitive to high expression protein 9, mitochondrial n=1 Tax=Aspergillus steynii IBT 23096 TaxID=1392250 RepID=A0A2I2G827_9EURO|nr:uncharacterized protein P170DRAFT_446815 [Aspergillus steynii IBT 23096]PLB49042.1 hypothetical protein P170DRAFT_446815 [Aspergillus steynii IBT 23096]